MTAKISKELENAIIEAYLSGDSSNKIAAKFGCSRTTCLAVLQRNNIRSRSPEEAHPRMPKEHEQAMIDAYLKGASTREAAELFGYSQQTCCHVLKRNNVKARSSLEVSQKYIIDQNFFETIDNEEKAYWLGFLTADGGVFGGELILALQSGDTNHLHKFATSLQSNHPIVAKEGSRRGRKYLYSYIRICSKKITEDLSQLGVVERKSLIAEPCSSIPKNLARHYWRGLIDGDGSIGYNRAIKNWSIKLYGTQSIVQAFSEFLSQYVISRSQVRKHKTIFVVSCVGNRLCSSISTILYDQATIYLDRKMMFAQMIMCGESPDVQETR